LKRPICAGEDALTAILVFDVIASGAFVLVTAVLP
jgi:hypothetical protein